MAAKPATLAAFKNLAVQTAQLDQQRKKIAKRVESVKAVLADALKKGDYSRIRIAQKALEADIEAIGASIGTGKKCVETLDTIREDDEFVADRLEAIDKLAQLIDLARDDLGKSFETLKGLQNQAEAAVAELSSERANLRIKMAGLERDATALMQRIDAAERSAQAIWASAVVAHDGRDQKALKAQTARFEGLGGADLQKEMDELKKEIGVYQKNATGFEPPLKALVLDTIKDLEPSLKSAQEQLDRLAENLGRLQKEMVIEPVNAKKALETLELDAKWLPKLTKALESPAADLERQLGVLAKEAKCDKSAKQMVEALKKAKLI